MRGVQRGAEDRQSRAGGEAGAQAPQERGGLAFLPDEIGQLAVDPLADVVLLEAGKRSGVRPRGPPVQDVE